MHPLKVISCALCASAALTADGLNIVGLIDTVFVRRLPFVVSSDFRQRLHIVWTFVEQQNAVYLRVTTPSQQQIIHRLPDLSPKFNSQVQRISLAGLVFAEVGRHTIEIIVSDFIMARMDLDLQIIAGLDICA